jgi:hypothetical protein
MEFENTVLFGSVPTQPFSASRFQERSRRSVIAFMDKEFETAR